MPLMGNALSGKWRPFLADSPWNTPIAPDAPTHPLSDEIMAHMRTKSSKLAMSRNYTIPVYVVDHTDMRLVKVKSDRIFDFYDADKDGISDEGVPWTPAMWAEQTQDGHICIVNPWAHMAWEMSRFKPPASPSDLPTCTTFNKWNLRLSGYGHPSEGERWTARGGRGSGFPIIPGLLRREQVQEDSIRNALVFTFPECRKAGDGSKIFVYPPACRSDGDFIGEKYPVQGDRWQLVATEDDFRRWGLSEAAKRVARALVKYGMFLCDKGGAWKIQPQLLGKTIDNQISEWAGLYAEIEKIPTSHFRILYTDEPTIKRG